MSVVVVARYYPGLSLTQHAEAAWLALTLSGWPVIASKSYILKWSTTCFSAQRYFKYKLYYFYWTK